MGILNVLDAGGEKGQADVHPHDLGNENAEGLQLPGTTACSAIREICQRMPHKRESNVRPFERWVSLC